MPPCEHFRLPFHLPCALTNPGTQRARYLRSSRSNVSDAELWDFLHGATIGDGDSEYDEAVEPENPSDDFSLVTDQPEGGGDHVA